MKTKRKTISVLMTLAMVMSMIPLFGVTSAADPVHYQLIVENGSARNLTTDSIDISSACEGDLIYVSVDLPPGKVFDHWELVKGKITKGFYENSMSLSFTMPAEEIHLLAICKDASQLVDTVVLSGGKLPKANEKVSYPITGLSSDTEDVTIGTSTNDLQWLYYPTGDYLTLAKAGSLFQPETEYYLKVILYLDSTTGKSWAENVTVTLDGKTCIPLETKIVGLGNTLSTLFCLGKPEEGMTPEPTHVVNVGSLNVRESPNTGSSRIGGLAGGKEVVVVDTQGEWSKIVYGDGYGWVQSKYLTLIKEPSVKTNPFLDIYESDPYYDAVLWAYYADPQITNGMDATHFGPQLTVTRAQAMTFLWRSMGCSEPSTTMNPFVDVPSGEWFYKPVLWAVEKGITKGVDDSHFNPDDTLSTLQMITFLYRTKNPGKDGWSGEAAAWAADENGRPFGVDTVVNNSTDCPRCHVVQFLYWLEH